MFPVFGRFFRLLLRETDFGGKIRELEVGTHEWLAHMFKRLTFLSNFLAALGAFQIEFTTVSDSMVEGTVIYPPDGIDRSCGGMFEEWEQEERQDFRWRATEADVPRKEVLLLVALIHYRRLLDIDKLRVDRAELRDLFNSFYRLTLDSEQFNAVLNELESIEVPMVDEGEESDIFFIHE
jgi:hypothetical protein